MSFAEVQERMNKNFSGANAEYLETYAGKMGILSNAAGEASETIGQSLMDALMTLSGDTSVEELAVTMETLASNTANAITEIAKLGKSVGNFLSEGYENVDNFSNDITDFIDRITGNSEAITRRNVGRAGRSFGGGSGGAGGNVETPEEKAQRLKREAAEAAAAKRNKELAALQKKTLDTQKKSNALTKAAKILDIDRINIAAALRGQISETDRLSLNLQLALLDQNETQATKLSGQLSEAVKRQNELSAALLATPEAPNPYRNWKIPDMGPSYNPATGGFNSGPLFDPPAFNVPPSTADSYNSATGGFNSGSSFDRTPQVNVTVILNEQEVGNAVQDVSVNNSLSGSFSTVNRYGRFGLSGTQ